MTAQEVSEMDKKNIDERVVADFGHEWSAYGRSLPDEEEHRKLFDAYFSIFPFDKLPDHAEGFDAGCGSGRWARFVAPRVGLLHCADPARGALDVAREHLAGYDNVKFHNVPVDGLPFADGSQDFGYSLGVLHHIPDTAEALACCVRKLKPGAPFLVYLYYRFDNRMNWYVSIWRISDVFRRLISRLPFRLKRLATDVIAATVYWPLARLARAAERAGADISSLPLSSYRATGFRTMRNDALDRFGTRLEQRFSRDEIAEMMKNAGLRDIRFQETEPYWVALGFRA